MSNDNREDVTGLERPDSPLNQKEPELKITPRTFDDLVDKLAEAVNEQPDAAERLTIALAERLGVDVDELIGGILNRGAQRAKEIAKVTAEEALILALVKNEQNYVLAESASYMGEGTPPVKAMFGDNVAEFIGSFVRALGTRHIVNVQPISAPIAKTYHLEYTYADTREPVTAPASAMNSSDGRKITLDIVDRVVEARSRKLHAGWSIEAQKDLEDFHGLDIARELRYAVAQEIASEFNASIYDDLVKLAGYRKTIDATNLCNFDVDDEVRAAAHTRLAVEINYATNEVARNTRRGPANWMVVPVSVLAMLQASLGRKFVKHEPQEGELRVGEFIHAGYLNETIRVYSYIGALEDTILLGYKGSSETDSGYTFAPFIPAMNGGTVIHPQTFVPYVRLMSRCAHSIHNQAESFYAVLTLENTPWSSVTGVQTEETVAARKEHEKYRNEINQARKEHHLEQFERAMRVVEGLRKLVD